MGAVIAREWGMWMRSSFYGRGLWFLAVQWSAGLPRRTCLDSHGPQNQNYTIAINL